ncbi:Intracellular growth attenuator protein [Magnetospirillum sp. LM-5]|uniref:c-type cytochrome n=1 Tax=Magnetospirillum sp. LM-5 TaxID=2681466 RepID=UPI00137E13E7|nr:c-type cytochrome [Magnetospirillum sp. LM-5]CAA7625379.1 Intracellular growth attenuator protein [Magnetospirillum sp. LM-5]
MRAVVLALMASLAAGAAAAQTAPAPVTLPGGKIWNFDIDNGREIMRTCAACHGEYGEGGGGGVYPRISGMHPDYLAEQLRAFKTRTRENIPMYPYANDRELPEKDVLDVSHYLATIKPPKHPPSDEVKMDAFERLKLAKQAVQIPREPGDVDKGRKLYEADCLECHARDGQGRVKKPPLAQQHMKYLQAQITLFLSNMRKHEDVDELIRPKSAEDWKNIWAHISVLDD